MLPISTFPRHDDYDEDEYILKTAGLRDTHSEGKATFRDRIRPLMTLTCALGTVELEESDTA